MPSGSQAGLIDAAWQQVAAIPRPPAGAAAPGSACERRGGALPHDAFPGYRLIGEIHRGGQGVVYKALQESTERHVAIKVLRDGHLLTETDIARFEQEVRVLGRLRHANIVRIYDSCAADGRFYYVMDYIPGLPLDAHVRQALPRFSSLDAIVRLFVKICDAVNAAHLRGIIHRDLKPGNIRVDHEGEPFVLDFGLSKLENDDTSDVTRSGQFVGSIPWAAPEQAQARLDAIDVRTDVYALGVLLYQLLTGEFPFKLDGNLHELLSQIVNAAPTPPRSIIANLPLDLETIVLKCLQKEPERRYQSAGELGRDLSRYLAGEAIEARRDSVAYVLAKRLARYKLAAIGAAGFLIVLCGGLTASLVFLRQADFARVAAESERSNAQKQTRIAHTANLLLNDMLSRADRSAQAGNADVRARDVLDETAVRLLDEAADVEPEVRETALGTIGNTYRVLGLLEQSERCLREVLRSRRARLGADHADIASSLLHLAGVLRDRGAPEQARPLAEEALAMRRRLLGDHDPLVGAALHELGTQLRALHDLTGAERLFSEAIEILSTNPPDDPEQIPSAKTNLALLMQTRGALADAERLYREALATFIDLHGPEHADVATVQNNLASLLKAKGEIDAAEEMYRRTLTLRRKLYGDQHAFVAVTLNNLAGLLHESRHDLEQAEQLYREALAIRERVLPPQHPDLIGNLDNIAGVLQDRGRIDDARALYHEVIARRRAASGGRSPDIARTLGNLATLHLDQGELAEAEQALREAVEMLRAAGGPAAPAFHVQLGSLGFVLLRRTAFADAEVCFREVLPIRQAAFGDVHDEVARALLGLGAALNGRGEYAEAESVLREALRQFRITSGPTHLRTLTCSDVLAMVLVEQAWSSRAGPDVARPRAVEAESLLREVVAARTATDDPTSVSLALSRSLLGGALVAVEALRHPSPPQTTVAESRLSEAETLLIPAFESVASRANAANATPADRVALMKAGERVVRLYEVWDAAHPDAGKRNLAAEWRLRLDESRTSTQPAHP